MSRPHTPPLLWQRRAFLAAAGAAVSFALLPLPAAAEPEDADEAIRRLFGDRAIRDGKVTLKLPPIAENGNSVQLTVSVDSPMTEQDHVRRIAIISPRNPIPRSPSSTSTLPPAERKSQPACALQAHSR